MKYDCLIIGGGMSGLAAGIRLAHYNKKVCICEQHSRLGGLNSYFSRDGIDFETGLHAITNFVPQNAKKNSPLLKLLRQLRIPYDTFMLREQNGSLINFPDITLSFSNNFQEFEDSVKKNFPAEFNGFTKLNSIIMEFDALNLANKYQSAKQIVGKYIKDPLLNHMIFCPLMFYGSAVENDMDFSQFAIMYRSIFHEGFCRPAGDGVRTIINALENRFGECGGETRKKCRIVKINTEGNNVKNVLTDNGEIIETDSVLSSAGYPETIMLCDHVPEDASPVNMGNLAFIELIAVVNPEYIKNFDFTIMFFNNSNEFFYQQPSTLVDQCSGVICLPTNFQFNSDDKKPTSMIRITALANHELWTDLKEEPYRKTKELITKQLIKNTEKKLNLEDIQNNALLIDMMTVKTFSRYTGRHRGAIYGSPTKLREGKTHLKNLFICGTDQGFLGIIGAMLSGISIANLHLLR